VHLFIGSVGDDIRLMFQLFEFGNLGKGIFVLFNHTQKDLSPFFDFIDEFLK
jgi:hypothetical protein